MIRCSCGNPLVSVEAICELCDVQVLASGSGSPALAICRRCAKPKCHHYSGRCYRDEDVMFLPPTASLPSRDWLDEIEAQIDSTGPYYVPRLIAEVRRMRAALIKARQCVSDARVAGAGPTARAIQVIGDALDGKL